MLSTGFRLFSLLLILLPLSCFNRLNLALGPQDESLVSLHEITLFDASSTSIGSRLSKKQVLLIPIEGEILGQKEPGGGAVYPGQIFRLLSTAVTSDFDAIIVKITSPGGSASASDTIYRMISRFARQRRVPVFVHIEDVGASGGYYIAMAGSHINASPVAVVGSIGVIIRTFGVLGLMDKVGVEYRSIKSGRNKDILSPFSELTEEQKKALQKQIDENYETFLSVIRRGRGNRISTAKLRRIADGSIYTAEQAKSLGLVDTVMPFEEYLEHVAREIGSSGLRVFSFLPEGRRDYNIYNTSLPVSISPQARMMRLVRSGVYYVWEGGL